ncbi:isochorismatase family protein, partial [Agathobacter sp.]
MVLLVVDTQKALVNDELYNYNEFIDNIQLLIKKARENNVEVIYVVHD